MTVLDRIIPEFRINRLPPEEKSVDLRYSDYDSTRTIQYTCYWWQGMAQHRYRREGISNHNRLETN